MEEKEKQEEFVKHLKTSNDPVEEWSTDRLKKEASGSSDKGNEQVISDIEKE